MKKLSVKKLALAGMLCALCVVGSVFSFPMFGSKCAPIQHMVNVTCAVLLGPWWGVGVAFVASLLTAAVLPQAVSAMAAASSRAVILVIFMDLLPSYNKKYRCIFKTITVLYQILW